MSDLHTMIMAAKTAQVAEVDYPTGALKCERQDCGMILYNSEESVPYDIGMPTNPLTGSPCRTTSSWICPVHLDKWKG